LTRPEIQIDVCLRSRQMGPIRRPAASVPASAGRPTVCRSRPSRLRPGRRSLFGVPVRSVSPNTDRFAIAPEPNHSKSRACLGASLGSASGDGKTGKDPLQICFLSSASFLIRRPPSSFPLFRYGHRLRAGTVSPPLLFSCRLTGRTEVATTSPATPVTWPLPPSSPQPRVSTRR
jgi:hypothetical protein